MSDNRIKSDDYLGGYADCYVITENRTKNELYRFLDRFLPEREVCCDEFPVPQYGSGPKTYIPTIGELLDYLERNPHEAYYICWRNLTESDAPFSPCMFTNDGALILGLSCWRKNDRYDSKSSVIISEEWSIAKRKFAEMKEFTDNAPGYITLEEPPPDDRKTFLQNCKMCEISEETI